jgi:hypothetical protein
VAFLLKRYGDEKVREVMREMSAGAGFPAAFEKAIGVAPAGFLSEFERYVKLRGFRGGRLRRPAANDAPLAPRLERPSRNPGSPPPTTQ